MDTISQSAHGPDMQARHPKDGGQRKTPVLLSPSLSPSHRPPPPQGTGVCQSFHSCPCLPTHQRPSTLGTWHRAPPILPGATAARGACPPSRLHSGTRHWLDTNVNLAGRANSGHPQRQLRAQAGPCWEISGCRQAPRAPLALSIPTPVGLTLSASIFSASHVRHPRFRRPPGELIVAEQGSTLEGDRAS